MQFSTRRFLTFLRQRTGIRRACAIADPASGQNRSAKNSVRSIFSPSPIAGNARDGPACRAGYL